MTSTLIPALASGGLVGFSLGLVGGGGSILATPLLLYVVGVASPHVAIGTSALAVSINAYANLIAHARKGHVRWLCAAVFAAVGTLGALLGSSLGLVFDGTRLLLLFGMLMVVVGLLMLRPRGIGGGEERPIDRRTCALTAAAALATGMASGFFGIGGGFLIVPGLIFATGMPMLQAVGTSLVAVTSFGATTAVSYAAAGMVDWLLAGVFVAGGLGGSLLGMRAGAHLSKQRGALTKVFAGLIVLVAAYILARSSGVMG